MSNVRLTAAQWCQVCERVFRASGVVWGQSAAESQVSLADIGPGG